MGGKEEARKVNDCRHNNFHTEQLNQVSLKYLLHQWDKGVISKAADIFVLSRQDQTYL